MMTIGELKKLLEGIQDNAIVMIKIGNRYPLYPTAYKTSGCSNGLCPNPSHIPSIMFELKEE
jgi:hypothetical protein